MTAFSKYANPHPGSLSLAFPPRCSLTLAGEG
jgi:hypothetical protein